MTIPTRLLAIALCACAACFVSTEELAPKNDAECGALEKACGYRCVPMSDPSVGCGGDSCAACPSGPGGEPAYCTSGLSCAYAPVVACTATQVDCDIAIPGCETNLLTDGANCGACGRGCAFGDSCSAGLCPASKLIGSATAPWDVDCGTTGWLVWLDDAGNLFDELGGLKGTFPNARLLAGDDASVYEYVSGSDIVGPSIQGRIWEVDLSGTTTVAPVVATHTSASIEGLSSNGSYVYWSASDADFVAFFEVGAAGAGAGFYGSLPSPSPRGIAAGFGGAYALVGDGVLVMPENVAVPPDPPAPGPGFYLDYAVPNHVAKRIAIGSVGAGVVVYVASEANGSVWGMPVDGSLPFQVWAGSGSATSRHMDIAADGEGVYWTDSWDGVVMAARNDGWVYYLAASGVPWGICLGPSPGVVAWTDAALATAGVWSVAK